MFCSSFYKPIIYPHNTTYTMKKTLLLLLCLLTGMAYLNAQCMRDSSIIGTDTLLSPETWTLTAPNYNLALACIGKPYTQSVTFNVPAEYLGFPLTSVNIATTGAVTNLPAGVSYVCDPPSCTFLSNTLGCVLISGTPDASNAAPDTLDLGISVNVNTALGSLPLEFPLGDQHYYLILQTAACQVNTNDLNGHLASVRNVPNPFSSLTQIEVGSYLAGDFRFEVFDMLGQRVYAEPIRLEEGINKFSFDAGYLANGNYIYTISNAEGKVSRLMAIAR